MLEVRLKIILPLCHQLYIRQSEIVVQHSVSQFALKITAFSIQGQYKDWIGFLFTFYFLSDGEWLQSLVVKILKQAKRVRKCYITKKFFFPLCLEKRKRDGTKKIRNEDQIRENEKEEEREREKEEKEVQKGKRRQREREREPKRKDKKEGRERKKEIINIIKCF